MSFFEKTLGANRSERVARLLEIQTESFAVIDLPILSHKLNLYPGGSILDIGTADGSFLAKIAKKTAKLHYLGLESNGELLEIARTRFEKAELPNIELEQAMFDCQYMKKHDAIMARFTLQHANNPQEFVQNVYNSLNRNGCFICIEPVYDYYDSVPPEKIWLAFRKRILASYQKWQSHPNIPKRISGWLSHCGFKSISISIHLYSPITIEHDRFQAVVLATAAMLKSEHPDIWDKSFLEKLERWLQKPVGDPFMAIAHIYAFK